MTEQEKQAHRREVIQECIDYLAARPGRHKSRGLQVLLECEQKPKQTKPAADHRWRNT